MPMSWKERKLYHSYVVLMHLLRQGQQRRSDIAAAVDGLPRTLQELCNQGCGCGFSVRSGNAENGAGANRKERLHFRSDHAALFPQRHELGAEGVESGSAEYHVRFDLLQIFVAQGQLCPLTLQLQHLRQQLFSGGTVPALHRNAAVQKHFNQRAVADAKSDHADPFSLEGFKIFVYCHVDQSLLYFI